MRGIEAACAGRLGRDPEQRTIKAANSMVVLNLAVDVDDGADAVWLKVLAFNAEAEKAATMAKGSRCYVEGRISLEQWTTQAGEPRASLTLMARLVQPMGQIGRKRPRKPRATQGAPDTDSHRAAIAAQAPADDFDDPISS